ncbi:DUF2989 domain-containing protein [Marinobacter hydrocarbonoclasticus]|nr:DUF2989 domain-containing protein [Marinobacter nauticus]
MKTFPLLPLLAVAALAGCDRAPTVRDICQASPELCADLNTSGWCRHDRAAIVHARYQFGLTNDVAHKFEELVKLESYVDCMSHVSQMVSKSGRKTLEQERSHFYLKSLDALEALQQETRDHSDPALSLYHWSRFNDEAALGRFLDAESQGQLHGIRLKRLAGLFFSESHPDKARDYLLDVVEADPEAAEQDSELLLQLGYVLSKLKQRETAYLFTYLGQPKQAPASPEALARHLGLAHTKVEQLVQRAEELADQMEAGRLPRAQLNL